MTTLISPSTYFPFYPYWGQNVTFLRGFMNNIHESLDGSEQRNLLVTKVRRSLVFTNITRNESETSYLKRYLNKYKTNVWGCPLWIYEMQLSQGIGIGQNVLNVHSTEHREMEVDDEVMIWKGYNRWEVGTVQSITDTQITLDSGVAASWSINTKVFPILRSVLQDTLTIAQETLQHLAIQLEFRESFRAS